MSEKRKERKKLFTGSFSRSFSTHKKTKSKQRDLTSVSDLYSLNPDPAKNLIPDPRIFLPLHRISIKQIYYAKLSK